MKKILGFRLFFLALFLFVFVGAKAGEYTYDFTSNTNWVTTSGGTTNPGSGSTSTLSNIYYVSTNAAFSFTGTAYFNSGYLMMKTSSTLSLPTYSGEKISSIVVYNSANCSVKTKVSVLSGTNTVSAAQNFAITGSSYTYSIPSAYQSSALTLNVSTYNCQITKIVVNTVSSSTVLASSPIISASSTEFSSSLDVTITNQESGATVYYTTDGTDPTTSSSSFTGSSKTITISATTTVKAMAVISGKSNSLIASGTYTCLPVVNTIAAFKALASGTRAVLMLTDVVVTYVNGNDHYCQDATGGINLYGSLSYTVGTVLNGSVTGTYKLYTGTPEVSDGTYNVTTTTGGSVTAKVVTIDDLTGDNKADYACLKITLQNVSYQGTCLQDEEGDTITLYDKAGVLSDYAWADQVNFTGVFCNYYTSSKTNPEVLPISADEITIVSGKAAPQNVWQITVYQGGSSNVYPTFTTQSDGTRNYTSSDTSTATVDASGGVTLQNLGTTTISCYAAESDKYKATQSASYQLLVRHALTGDGTFENPYTPADVIELNGSKTDRCWTAGVIVNGSAKSTSSSDAVGIDQTNIVNTNLVLTADGSVTADNLPVKLEDTPIREWVNIKENSTAGQTVKIYGTLGTYFSRPGITQCTRVYVCNHYYTYLWGDVDANLSRDTQDVEALVNILLTGTDTTGGMSDVTGDRTTSLKDLPKLINYLR